jgi:pyruvate dehydrogenase E2 component (dihydrolipoamide acetyltransferase)
MHESGRHEHEINGSGPDGRILAADVEAALVREPAREPARAPTRAPKFWREGQLSGPAPAEFHAKTRSVAVAPAFLAVEVDVFGLDRVRRAASEPLEHLPFVARAVVDALAEFPYLNAELGEQTVLVSRPVHLGIAVELAPDGLTVPVIRDADSLRLASLARRLTTMVDRARAGRLGPLDSRGATFTISDPGPRGMLLAAPILGPTQVATLATGAVRPKPVAVEREPGEYAVAVHPVGTLGLSFDPDAIDSGYAARFLDRVRDALETRDWSAEL